MMKLLIVAILLLAIPPMAYCSGDDSTGVDSLVKSKGVVSMELKLMCDAFADSAMIPVKFTCDGADISPALKWSGVPASAKSLALICDDPDAPMGTWVHWVLFNLPADTAGLPEGLPQKEILNNGARHGFTDFKRFGYGGPCPPSGTHRYFFKLYALDIMLELKGKVTKSQLETAMKGHIVAEAELMGRYSRKWLPDRR